MGELPLLQSEPSHHVDYARDLPVRLDIAAERENQLNLNTILKYLNLSTKNKNKILKVYKY